MARSGRHGFSQGVEALRIQAKMSVAIDADDYVTAGEHQLFLERLAGEIRNRFPHTTLDIRRSRRPSRNAKPTPAPPRQPTGALNDYAD